MSAPQSLPEIFGALRTVHINLVGLVDMLEVLEDPATEGKVTCGQLRLLGMVVQDAVNDIEEITDQAPPERSEAAA